jgi:hypothetical protein
MRPIEVNRPLRIVDPLPTETISKLLRIERLFPASSAVVRGRFRIKDLAAHRFEAFGVLSSSAPISRQ